jgi:hypothetical protein
LSNVIDLPPPETAAAAAAAPLPRAPLPEVQGLVDRAHPDRLYGWAWNASVPGERVAVELRLGDAPVARAVADLARHDLEKAGVGDGRHAFELPLEPEWVRRASELSVVVRTADGVATPIPMRVRRQAPDALPGAAAGMQRALDGLSAGQERLAAQVADLASRAPGAEDREAVQGLVVAQAVLAERLDTLTLWLARLDERLAEPGPMAATTAPPPPAPARRRRLDVWQVVLFVLLGAVAAGGVAAGFVLGG